MSTFPKLQRLISSKPFVRFEFRANFWPLQGPQKSIVTSPTVSSRAEFRPLYANEHLVISQKVKSTSPLVAAGRTGLLSHRQRHPAKSTGPLKPWGLLIALQQPITTQRLRCWRRRFQSAFKSRGSAGIVGGSRCRHPHLLQQVSRVTFVHFLHCRSTHHSLDFVVA